MKLAVLSGLKVTLGPAMLKTARGCPTAQTWVTAALGELFIDKLPFMPKRSFLPLMIPRAISGGWVARASMRADGYDDPWAAPMGAAVAAGVAVLAPILRNAAGRILDVPDPLIAMAEDYAALKIGSSAVGMSMNEIGQSARESVEGMKEKVMPTLQSIGAGSM